MSAAWLASDSWFRFCVAGVVIQVVVVVVVVVAVNDVAGAAIVCFHQCRCWLCFMLVSLFVFFSFFLADVAVSC